MCALSCSLRFASRSFASAICSADFSATFIALEIILPILIIVGFQARVAAGVLAIFCLATAFIFHLDFSNQSQFISFLKNIGLAGGFLFIVANGTKDWAVDKEKKYVRL